MKKQESTIREVAQMLGRSRVWVYKNLHLVYGECDKAGRTIVISKAGVKQLKEISQSRPVRGRPRKDSKKKT